LILSSICFFNKRIGIIALIISVSVCLFFLPNTGDDYIYYKQAFDNAVYSSEFPFFVTNSTLTAEPLYLFYSSLISVVTQLDFEYFLVINFLLCFFIFNSKSLFKSENMNCLFWLMMLPVIIPTIFYFSPRSSLSFFLVLIGLFFLIEMNRVKAVLMFFLAIIFHSQYILIISYLLFVEYFILNKNKVGKNSVIYLLLTVSFLFFAIKILPYMISTISSLFSFLPSATVAISKLHYLTGDSDGSIRMTSLLSIIIFPVLATQVFRKNNLVYKKIGLDEDRTKRLSFYILACALFGMCINISFFNLPHVSGRLGRFSDYFCLVILIPIFFRMYFTFKTVVLISIFFILIAPVLYPTVYTVIN